MRCLRSFLICCLFCFSFYSHALLAQFDFLQEDFPKGNWQTLKAPSLRVHFLLDDEPLAQRAFSISQQALAKLSQSLSWQLQSPVHIVISHQQDSPNGYATALPYNYVVIYSPKPSRFSELSDYDSWLESLLLHELTHTVHLDKAGGFPKVLRQIIGRNPLTFPNTLQPAFLKEGLATYIETSWDKGIGRGQSAYFELMMRQELMHGLQDLNQTQLVTAQWPLNAAYLYGVYFYQFIDEVYGPEQISRFVDIYSRQIIPFLLYRPAKAISDKDGLNDLWQAFQHWLAQRFRAQIEALDAAPKKVSQAITDTGLIHGKPYVDGDGRVFYAKHDPFHPTQLTMYTAGQEELLTEVLGDVVILGADAQSVWFSQSSNCTHDQQSNDIYRYDFDSSTQWLTGPSRLTHCLGLVAGQMNQQLELAGVIEDRGRQQLIRLNLSTLHKTLLYHGNYDETLGDATFNKDNSKIILARKPANQTWQIHRFDIQSRSFDTLVAEQQHNFFSPSLDINNNILYLGSDKNKLLEVWQYDLAKQQLAQTTFSAGGAINPAISPDGKTLYYQSYSYNGWDIHQGNSQAIASQSLPKLEKPGQGYEMQWQALDTAPEALPTYTAYSAYSAYSAWPSLLPRSWVFAAYNSGETSEIGISTSGRDILNYHNYNLGFSYDTDNEVSSGALHYTYRNHYSLGYARFYDFSEQRSVNGVNFTQKETNERASASIHGAIPSGYHHWQWFIGGLRHKDRTFISFNKQEIKIASEIIDVGGIALGFSNTDKPMDAISESFGRHVSLSIEHDHRNTVISGLSFQNTKGLLATIDWREYIHLYQAHTLALRAYGAFGEEGIKPFQLGEEQSQVLGLHSPIYHRDQSLRGYSDNSALLAGRKVHLTSAEYRFPLASVHRGISSWPLGLHKLYGSLFYDNGAATFTDKFNYYDSAGLELYADLDLGYIAIMSVSAGIAQPLKAIDTNIDKDPEYYFRLSASF